MAVTRTQILSLAVLFAAAAMVWSIARLDSAHGRAIAAGSDLAAVHRNIVDMAHPGDGISRTPNPSELDRRINFAAAAAGLTDQLSSREPGNVVRVGDSDYNETSMTFRFNPVTLRQLTVFLRELATIDPSSRAKEIELTPSPSNAAGESGNDRWTADITIAYLIFAPKEPSK